MHGNAIGYSCHGMTFIRKRLKRTPDGHHFSKNINRDALVQSGRILGIHHPFRTLIRATRT